MQDLRLVQALIGAREVARRHEGDVWRRLESRLDGLLGELHDRDPDDHVGTEEPRLDRTALDTGRSEDVMAALLALGDRPDDTTAEAALERLDGMDGGEGRDDRPTPPEPDPALTDEGW